MKSKGRTSREVLTFTSFLEVLLRSLAGGGWPKAFGHQRVEDRNRELLQGSLILRHPDELGAVSALHPRVDLLCEISSIAAGNDLALHTACTNLVHLLPLLANGF